jgi:hypothetical protein
MPQPTPSPSSRLVVWLLLAAGWMLPAHAVQQNAWPLAVRTDDAPAGLVTTQALGPIIEGKRTADGANQSVVRPLWLQQDNERGSRGHFLYPLVSWETAAAYRTFSIFQVINFRREAMGGGAPRQGFDVWPLYFSRETGDPETSYRALLPVAGTIKHRFGRDQLDWVAFPLYFHVEQRGRHTHYTPWPFIRRIHGEGHRGFEFWLIAGQRGRENDYREQFYLWPLIYKQERNLSEPVPDVKFGVLPFYTRDTGLGFVQENYLWPFFGYTHRTEPQRYDETRYFWPLLVQGRGDDRHVNRWAPFYTHSVVKGYEKTWLMWPLVRRAKWTDGNIAQERTQFLFFLYWSNEQRSLSRPGVAPAYKRHFWPLASVWDNGAGRRQLQLLSPLEVFFPHNDPVRQLYSPLVALYRYDERAPDDVRWSLLWNAVSSRRAPGEREFHLGPLFGTHRDAAGERITIGAGILSWRRDAGQPRWRFSLFDFRRSPANPGQSVASP